MLRFENDNLHKMLKVSAANNDKSMNEFVLQNIEKVLKNDFEMQKG